MYKVIEGHRYDTETAKQLAHWEASCSTSDFSYCEETLYRTKAGLYFIHGEGGPMTRYSRQASDGSIGWGEKIEPLSEETAKAWTERRCDGDTYERIFGDPERSRRTFTVALSTQDAARFEEIKKASGKSYTELLAGWIWEYEL